MPAPTKTVEIFSALVRGSVFPQGPWDLALWFAGEPVPARADAGDAPGRPDHRISVPAGWDWIRGGEDGEGSGGLWLSDGLECLDACEVLLAALTETRPGFLYLTSEDVFEC